MKSKNDTLTFSPGSDFDLTMKTSDKFINQNSQIEKANILIFGEFRQIIQDVDLIVRR